MATVSDVAASTGLRTYESYLESTRSTGSTLGKNEFLQLLAAQLQYQDPLEPMSDSEFVAQLAQFSSLEQLENLNNTMSTYQYFGLAGKYVATDIELDDGRVGTLVGVVDSVFTNGGTSYSTLGGCIFIDEEGNASSLSGSYTVKSSSINQVYDGDLFKTSSSTTLLEAATLIGRTVTAKVTETVVVVDEHGEPVLDEETGEEVTTKETRELTGVVTRVAMTDDGIVAYLDDGEQTIPINDIVDIQK